MSASTAAPVSFEGSPKNHRTASDADALAQSFLDNLLFVQGRTRERATVNDLYMALAHTVRDRLVERWMSTVHNYRAQDVRVVCYLSAEFLTGPHLANNLINLDIYKETEHIDAYANSAGSAAACDCSHAKRYYRFWGLCP